MTTICPTVSDYVTRTDHGTASDASPTSTPAVSESSELSASPFQDSNAVGVNSIYFFLHSMEINRVFGLM